MSRPRDDRPLIVYGAGGHGRAVAEAAQLAGFTLLGFVDDAPQATTRPAIDLDDPSAASAALIVAIGDNAARGRIARDLAARGRTFATVVHPRAFVSPSASVGPGVFIGPAAVVHTAARVEEGAIVNSGAIVEHDCRVDGFAHVAPGAALAGGVHLGAEAMVGLGARVLPKITIGRAAVVGAGAVVIRDVADGACVAGVPARPLRRP